MDKIVVKFVDLNAMLAGWFELLPPTHVAWVRFRTRHHVWVELLASPLSYETGGVFHAIKSLSPKNQHVLFDLF